MTGKLISTITFLALLGLSVTELQPRVQSQSGIQTFTDRAAFLAATGATSATGPLPNLGFIGSGPATAGSVTFGLAPGGDNISIGALNISGVPGGDWYPQTPGHDIALGYENLQVEFATPVYSMGFDFVEPNLTMPAYGGAPVDSLFQVSLFNGATEVASFTFNAPDDQLAFVGVSSALPFTRAWISDTTGNDDDEYFGGFYSATATAVSATTLTTQVLHALAAGPPYPTSPVLLDMKADAIPVEVLGLSLQSACTRAGPTEPCQPLSLQITSACTRAGPVEPCQPTVTTTFQLSGGSTLQAESLFDVDVSLGQSGAVAPVLIPPDPIIPPGPITFFDVSYEVFLPGVGLAAQTLRFETDQPVAFSNIVIGGPQSPAFHINFTLRRTGGELAEGPLFTVTNSGQFVELPACASAQAVPAILWPPNHRLAPVDLFAGQGARITILAVSQDEPVNGTGDGATSPDAVIERSSRSDRLRLRAERAGAGNGRVYHVTFVAQDAAGARCLDKVRVCAPHANNGRRCIDGGLLHDSTKRQ